MVRVLLATGDPAHLVELRAIIDTVRVWRRARRAAPRVVEMDPFRAAPALTLRLTTAEQYRPSRWPPGPVTTWLLRDPRGRRLGRDPATGAWYSEVPAITQGSAVESGFALREVVEGRYRLDVAASAPSVGYRIAVRGPDRAGAPFTAHHAGRTAEPGAVDRYDIVYARGSAPVVAITEAPGTWRFGVVLSSREDAIGAVTLTDPQGRNAGVLRDISDAATGMRGVAIDVRQPADGAYLLQVVGAAPGRYTLDLHGWDRSGTVSARPEIRDVPTAAGAVHSYRLDYASPAASPLKLAGRFEGDRLLTYANVTSPEFRLDAGATSFPLVVFYGAGIAAVTFSALVNGDNISGRFTPEPEGREIVRIPLVPGVNTLVMSVAGVTADGRAVTDTHRLLIRVE